MAGITVWRLYRNNKLIKRYYSPPSIYDVMEELHIGDGMMMSEEVISAFLTGYQPLSFFGDVITLEKVTIPVDTLETCQVKHNKSNSDTLPSPEHLTPNKLAEATIAADYSDKEGKSVLVYIDQDGNENTFQVTPGSILTFNPEDIAAIKGHTHSILKKSVEDLFTPGLFVTQKEETEPRVKIWALIGDTNKLLGWWVLKPSAQALANLLKGQFGADLTKDGAQLLLNDTAIVFSDHHIRLKEVEEAAS